MITVSMLTHETKYYSTAFLTQHIQLNITNFWNTASTLNIILLTRILLQQVIECIITMIISIITTTETNITFNKWQLGLDQQRLLCR